MTHRMKKRFAVVFLLMSYCVGVFFAPIYAQDDNGFDALLSERESSASTAVNVVKKADISDFSDVEENDWFYKYLDYLVKNEIVNGKTPTAFEPGSTFSYAECSAVIVRYLGLEQEAEKRKEKIDERHPEMKNFWYSGYFEVLSNLGVFDDYDLFEVNDGLIYEIDKNAANSPILRYRFAESISKSFELDAGILAKNEYSEIGGRGREFIVGAGYDEGILEKYKTLINDFDEVPEQSKKYVLKAYYNGIFNGDVSGNFYPNNNLTRGEMAKVLATVMDYSLRTRLINEDYGRILDENCFHTDAFGIKTVRYDTWLDILYMEGLNLEVNEGTVSYVRDSKNVPYGYAADVYLYDLVGETYVHKAGVTLHDGNDSFAYKTNNAKVLFVLRNLTENLRTEGVIELRIVNGEIASVEPKVYEMPTQEEIEMYKAETGTPKILGVL